MTERKRTLAQEKARLGLVRATEKARVFVEYQRLRDGLIPRDWGIEADFMEEMQPQVRMALMLDEDVAKWYRRFGQGYQEQMNTVLRIFMLNVIAKEQEGFYDRSFGEGKPL